MLIKERLKLICATIFIAAVAAILFTNNRAIETASANASGPPAGRSGAPGELTCAASGCHSVPNVTNEDRFRIEAPAAYMPGQTYQITVRHVSADSSRRRWGFQLTALTSSNDRAGNLQTGDSPTFVINNDGPGGNRQYIEHGAGGTFPGTTGGASWTFNWVAPANPVGRVTFYAAGNQANNDQNNTGDQIFTATATINPASGRPPRILGASVSGKKLMVTGEDFDTGAALLMDGKKQKKTSNDDANPSMIIIAKKAGKLIDRGQTVTLQVRNLDGTLSEEFSFTRPE